MKDIKSLNLEELTEYVVELSEPKFRGKQLYQWLHAKHVESLEEMTNIPASLKNKLSENADKAALVAP